MVRPHLPPAGPLRWFWLDGLATSVADNMLLAFVPLYALALGATNSQIGLLSSAGALAGTVALLPGARLAERLGRPHGTALSLLALARGMVLLLALWPLTGRAGVGIVLLLATLRAIFSQAALPAWTTVAAEIVPAGLRGRYFASRNMAMALAAAVAVPLGGWIIDRSGGVAGYRLNFAVAFIVALAGLFAYARVQSARSGGEGVVAGKRFPLLVRLKRRRTLLLFCAHAAIWSFALQISAPFFNVFLVGEAGATTAEVGLLATVSTLASLPGLYLFGRAADRWGSRWTARLTGSLIPLAPLAWLWVRDPLHVVPINLFAGFLWAGFNLATFNYLLEITPDHNRPRYIAFYSTVVGLAGAAGAAAGGIVGDLFSFQSLFALSAVGRAVAMLFFWGFLREPPVEPPDE